MVECKYRGRVIGWLVTGEDGEMRYRSRVSGWQDRLHAEAQMQRIRSLWGMDYREA